MRHYQSIVKERERYLGLLCQVLGVPASSYYTQQVDQQRAVGYLKPLAWEAVLAKTFGHHQRRRFTRWLRVNQRQKGHLTSLPRLRMAMRSRGLCALQPKAYTPRTTNSTHGLRCVPNRLLDQPMPTWANRVWVSDITYVPLATGICACLCACLNVASQRVVGWHAAAIMPEKLIAMALQRRFLTQPPTSGLVAHFDNGGQCLENAYRSLLHQHEAVHSQSLWVECYDNAQAERLWSRLKTELLKLRD